MSVTRRNALKSLATGTGSALFAPGVFHCQNAFAASPATGPKRVIFFLQNHGFDPRHARPIEIPFFNELDRVEDVDLKTLKLPPFIDLLNPYKDRLTIVHGLNGGHVSPGHGSPYGCLGGFLKGPTPRGETIDIPGGWPRQHRPGFIGRRREQAGADAAESADGLQQHLRSRQLG
jgi:hypothetical protein